MLEIRQGKEGRSRVERNVLCNGVHMLSRRKGDREEEEKQVISGSDLCFQGCVEQGKRRRGLLRPGQ